MPAPLAGYTRVSRIGDRKDSLMSHEDQRSAIETYASAHGLEVDFLPEESDISGGKVERPVLEEGIRGVEDGRYGGVIVAYVKRFSRWNIVDAVKTMNRITEAGGRVIAVQENYDSRTTPKLVRNVWLSIAEDELDRYKLQFRAAKQRAVEAGIWPFPVVPPGFVCERRKDGGNGKLRPGDPEVIAMVLRAFEARASGVSWDGVGKIVGRSGSGASRLIEQRAYIGEIRYTDGSGDVWVNRKAHDAIVPRDLWLAAQIDHPRHSRNGAVPALLRGLVRCSGCSCRMTVEVSGGRRYYACKPRGRAGEDCRATAQISQPKLDDYVERLVLPYIESLEFSAARRGRALEEAMEKLREAEDELAAFQDVVKVTDVGKEAFAVGMRSRVEGVKQAQRVVGEARAAAGDLPEAGTLGDRWPKMSVEQRNHLLSRSLGAVFVRKGRGVSAERVKVLARGFEPGNLPRHHGRQRVVPRPFEWVDNLPGEVTVATAEDFAESVGSAAA